ncbi:hypothetical protein [Acinetobacter populi]|jgi:hypothetical protein|uniref:DUF432 domain-containing protein n=1 Tax=Acinetobacter populi TaxID=1582270 RepID=A0A1Z9Z1I1_9GAMM|nr:hypothetical protein [Acinetobacter populi]MCH4246295.1 hypothetical protein [Acinetobacter populi]OUY08341.1 hypothetical protein CAP51_01585 [Acinetobacter populi]
MLDKLDHVETDLKWWGEFHFSLHQAYSWRFGSLYFRLIRNEKEWRIEYHRPQNQHESQQDWQKLDPDELFPAPILFERYMFNRTGEKIFLLPRLADRSVVIKPVQPIYIPAGQRASLFISTPLWICGIVDNQKKPLFDFPVIRPKDTWFGMSKMEGQLCYATPVDGSTDLKLLKPRAFRAITPIHFYNDSNQQMRLERINVPVHSLPLFHSEETGRLWTSEIKVYQDSIDRPPRIRIETRTPPMAGEVTYIQPARTESAGFITNMFESLF